MKIKLRSQEEDKTMKEESTTSTKPTNFSQFITSCTATLALLLVKCNYDQIKILGSSQITRMRKIQSNYKEANIIRLIFHGYSNSTSTLNDNIMSFKLPCEMFNHD